MHKGKRVGVVIPAFNEEEAIGKVLDEIPDWVDDIVVGDNASTDRTAEVAHAHGARVILENERGYGAACLAALAVLEPVDIVVFLDADFSDKPDEMGSLVDPIANGSSDMVIGSRMIGSREDGALLPQAIFGNWLASRLMRLFWGVRQTDLGPFRAISKRAYDMLHMADRNFGWTVEMQVKAAVAGLRVCEVPVSYRCRIGVSKISGTLRGVIGAGTKILYMIFKYLLFKPRVTHQRTERIIIFSRLPEPGTTKTRMIPALGPDGAAELQRQMTLHALEQARAFAKERSAEVEVRFVGGDADAMADCFGDGVSYRPQSNGDLGVKMERAASVAFDEGAERVVIIGSDCPGITPKVLQDAFGQLREQDLVLGPATDGGYYLIGMGRRLPELFHGPDWGSDTVFDSTVQIARKHGISLGLLQRLDDVDRPDDLPVWRQALGAKGDASVERRVSVIIPALNEAAVLGDVLKGLLDEPDVEVMVVDGGSTDGTPDIARSLGAAVLTDTTCRGHRMNVGARATTGDIVLFLHADTRLPVGFGAMIREALTEPGIVAGAFGLRIEADAPIFRLVEGFVRIRSRCLGMPYGDQGLFLKRSVFELVGGFPEAPIMEDFRFVRALRKIGKVAILSANAHTSPRRWRKLGVIRTTIINQCVLIAHFLGFSPDKIAGFYRRHQPTCEDSE
jgi:uncharacterized protein